MNKVLLVQDGSYLRFVETNLINILNKIGRFMQFEMSEIKTRVHKSYVPCAGSTNNNNCRIKSTVYYGKNSDKLVDQRLKRMSFVLGKQERKNSWAANTAKDYNDSIVTGTNLSLFGISRNQKF